MRPSPTPFPMEMRPMRSTPQILTSLSSSQCSLIVSASMTSVLTELSDVVCKVASVCDYELVLLKFSLCWDGSILHFMCDGAKEFFV